MVRPPVVELEKLISQVATDHGSDVEATTGIYQAIEKHVRFPFRAEASGLGRLFDGQVSVEAVEPSSFHSGEVVAVTLCQGRVERLPLDAIELEERFPGAEWIDACRHFSRHHWYRSLYRGTEPGHQQVHRCGDSHLEENAWCIGELMNWWEERRDPRRLPGCVSLTIAGFLYSWWDALGRPEAERLIAPLIPQLPGTRRSREWGLERRLYLMVLGWASGPRALAWVRLNDSGRFQEALDKLPLQGLGEIDSLPQQRAWSVTRPPATSLGTDESLRIGASAAKREARRTAEAARHLPTKYLRQETTDRATRYSAFATMQYCAQRGTSTVIAACQQRAAAYAPGDVAIFVANGGPPYREAIYPTGKTNEEIIEGYTRASRKRRREPALVEAAIAWDQFCKTEGWPKVRDQAYALASLAARVATIDEVRSGRRKQAGALAEATAIRVTMEFLDPAVSEIQGSAIELVQRIIQVAKEEASPRALKPRPVGPNSTDSAEPLSG